METTEGKFLRIFQEGKYFELQHLSDGKLHTDDGCTFDIHRFKLATNCPYFRAMFCGKDKARREFTIPGISGECLCDILCYIYTRHICVTEKNLADLLAGADYLLMKDLYLNIKSNIQAKMTDVNCLRILFVAYQIGDKDIFPACFRFIQTRFEGIMRSQKDDIPDLPIELLKNILSNGSLYIFSESTVWQAVVEWIERDIQSRCCLVPELLLCLAMEEIGENLATEILQHEIVLGNSYMNSVKRIKYSNDFPNNHEILQNILRNRSTNVVELYSYRIPPRLIVFFSCTSREEAVRNLCITYDENPDLWRKITEVDFFGDSLIHLVTIGHNIYIIDKDSNTCKSFDLSTVQWVPMEDFAHKFRNFSVVAIDRFIYVIEYDEFNKLRGTYDIEIYDTENRMWFDGVTLRNIYSPAAVTLEKKIYVVGKADSRWDSRAMMMQVFDPVTQQWSLLPPPKDVLSNVILVEYHKKIYLIEKWSTRDGIGLPKSQVFDPATNLWKKLPDLPCQYKYPAAKVLNDQMIVFENDDFLAGYVEPDEPDEPDKPDECYKKNVVWNDIEECWKKTEETNPLKDFRLHRFCTIEDVETIKMFTKHKRDPVIEFEKSVFN